MADKPKGSALMTLLKVGVGLIVLLAIVVLGGAAIFPADFSYAQSTTIKADRDDVHEWAGDLKKWNEWGPWKKEDPEMKSTYSEKTNEVGSWHQWTGPKSGEGKMEFTKVSEKEGIEYRIWFNEKDTGVGGVKYEDADGGTKVTWWWKGTAGYPLERWFHKLGGSFIDDMFTEGLAGLKSSVEAKK